MTAWTVSSVRVRVPRIALLFILGCFSLACLPSLSSAQTVSPQTVEFDPSADHNATVGGVAVVEGYELRFYTVGGAQPVHVIELGKPTPEADGKIRFNFASPLGAWPVNGVVYEARVAAVGPGGSTVSAISNQFVFPRHDATAGAVQLRLVVDRPIRSRGRDDRYVERDRGHRLCLDGGERRRMAHRHERCERQRQRIDRLLGRRQLDHEPARRPSDNRRRDLHLHPGWRRVRLHVLPHDADRRHRGHDGQRRRHIRYRLRLDGGKLRDMAQHHERRHGIGNGTINYSVTANSGSSVRSATLTVGTTTFTLTQSGSCTYGLSPTTLNVGTAATTGSVAATAGSGCAWTATSSATWLSITGGGTGTGNGTVNYSVAANSSTSTRSATITVGTATFSLTQDGACGYTLSPTTRTGHDGRDDGQRRRHGWECVFLVGLELGCLADGDERWQRDGERHGELQRRRQRGVRRTFGHLDSRVSHIHGDAERLLRLHRDAHEPRLQPPDRHCERDGDRGQRMLVDRHAIGDPGSRSPAAPAGQGTALCATASRRTAVHPHGLAR